jgi:hypothetical protein
VQSSSFLYRTHSVLAQPPFKNIVWLGGVFVALSLQFVYSMLSADSFTWVPWEMWLVIFLWPVFVLAINEKVNAYDARTYDRYVKFLQLEFDTRLGMYSPR